MGTDAELIDFIKHKREWEGFPEFIEWVDCDEASDPELKSILFAILDAHIELDKLAHELDGYINDHSVNDPE